MGRRAVVGADMVERMGGGQEMRTLVRPVRLSDAPRSRLREQYEPGGAARKDGGWGEGGEDAPGHLKVYVFIRWAAWDAPVTSVDSHSTGNP